jgi:hypothetical protein
LQAVLDYLANRRSDFVSVAGILTATMLVSGSASGINHKKQTREVPMGMKKFRVMAFCFFLFFLSALVSAPAADPVFPLVGGKQLGLARTCDPGVLHRVLIGFESMPGRAEEAIVLKAGGSIRYTYHLVPAIAAIIPEARRRGAFNSCTLPHLFARMTEVIFS